MINLIIIFCKKYQRWQTVSPKLKGFLIIWFNSLDNMVMRKFQELRSQQSKNLRSSTISISRSRRKSWMITSEPSYKMKKSKWRSHSPRNKTKWESTRWRRLTSTLMIWRSRQWLTWEKSSNKIRLLTRHFLKTWWFKD